MYCSRDRNTYRDATFRSEGASQCSQHRSRRGEQFITTYPPRCSTHTQEPSSHDKNNSAKRTRYQQTRHTAIHAATGTASSGRNPQCSLSTPPPPPSPCASRKRTAPVNTATRDRSHDGHSKPKTKQKITPCKHTAQSLQTTPPPLLLQRNRGNEAPRLPRSMQTLPLPPRPGPRLQRRDCLVQGPGWP